MAQEEQGLPLRQHTFERAGSARREGKIFAAAAAATIAAAKMSSQKESSAASSGAAAASAVRRAAPARMAMAALGSRMGAGRNATGGVGGEGAEANDTSNSGNSGAMTHRRPEPSGRSVADGGAGAGAGAVESTGADHVVVEMTAQPQLPQQ